MIITSQFHSNRLQVTLSDHNEDTFVVDLFDGFRVVSSIQMTRDELQNLYDRIGAVL